MSSRSALRRKVVLPVSVIRHDGEEKQLAHTLDLTEDSARLGGLCCVLETGEIVELQRGNMKAKFQVFWMGAPGSAMAGQAGVRSVEPNKCIWNGLPTDQPDPRTEVSKVRIAPLIDRTTPQLPGERRWHTRYECKGSASIKTKDMSYPIMAAVKDVSIGGLYLEMTTPLPVNTHIQLKINIEDTYFDAVGLVRTSYPMVGMGISFQEMTLENQDKMVHIIEQIKHKTTGLLNRSQNLITKTDAGQRANSTLPVLRLEIYPAKTLVMACQKLASEFDRWKQSHSVEELEEFRQAVCELQHKLSAPPAEIANYLASAMPRSGVI